MNIKHHPIYTDPKKVEKLYSEKDGVPVKYVCSSAKDSSAQAMDIYYRDTPHPNFGNRYFGLFYKYDVTDPTNKWLMITNADVIEEVEFIMVEGTEGWEYSQDRHDFRPIPGTSTSIDGGRAYCRIVGDLSLPIKTFVVRDGKFAESINDPY